jgi:AmmeMemoRadiSam system protein B/AmmeMemoRadiSam system protein A
MKNTLNHIDRQPAVAGHFYSERPEKLNDELQNCFALAVPKKYQQVRAIICPHAGYVYSGRIAASAYNQIDAELNYHRIFIIASSHHDYFDKASIYCEGDYIMPYGKEIVDEVFGKQLVELYPHIFTTNSAPHQNEHSVEVQLPFLHHIMKTDYKIVPIIIGTNQHELCRQIANALKPYLNEDNLFIISTDFSHYPKYDDAVRVDNLTKEAILINNPDVLLHTLNENSRKHIPNLATSLCGWTSVLSLMYMTSENETLEYHAIDYCNSGDSKYEDELDRVVGYWAIALTEKTLPLREFQISENERKSLLNIARKSIEQHCINGTRYTVDRTEISNTLNLECGVFVSLHKKGTLRGCIGLTKSDLPLYQSVQEMAIAAACNDYRFKSIEKDELKDIEIEISVLSPLKKIENIAEIKLGKHGIFIEKGGHAGLFLPQVATDTGWSKEEFLGHCAHDKAHLEWDGWKTADIYIFTATVFA